MIDYEDFADRYVAVWNERDADARRRQVAALWAEEATHLTANLEAQGHDAIEARVARAYTEFVCQGGYVFRRHGPIHAHHDALKLRWEMAPADGGDPAALGLQVLFFGKDGRLCVDYQFSEPMAA
jgi:hypothetical protein